MVGHKIIGVLQLGHSSWDHLSFFIYVNDIYVKICSPHAANYAKFGDVTLLDSVGDDDRGFWPRYAAMQLVLKKSAHGK